MILQHLAGIREPAGRAGSSVAQLSGRGPLFQDGLFIAAVVAVSCVAYLPGLGLYSDDWSFLAHLHGAGGGSFAELFRAILDDGLHARPIQALNLALLYRLFGLEPLGYHVVNSGVLACAVLLFHVLLRSIGVRREVAVAVPLVFGLLPHYSTDRLWIAAFQANLAILALFASAWADVRFVRASDAVPRWTWKVVGTAALLASVLAYEVTGPLFLLTPFVAWFGRRRPAVGQRRRRWPLWILLGSNLAALALAVAYKASVSDRTAFTGGYLWRVIMTAREATTVAFGSYGLALPIKVGRALSEHFDAVVFSMSLAVGLVTWAYLRYGVGREERPFPRWPAWVGLLAVGGLAFGLGYGAALLTWDIGFDTTGINNRTAIAAAPGVATVLVAVLGLASGAWRKDRSRWRSFRVLIAALGVSGCLLVNTIATFWVQAAAEQRDIVEALHQALPDPPAGSTVLLDGICPYRGPATVFETSWDMWGMLTLTFGDPTLRGDVLEEDSELTAEGVRTILYDDVVNVYPYGQDLRVFRVDDGTLHRLPTLADARRYFEERRSRPCPPGVEGYGVRIF